MRLRWPSWTHVAAVAIVSVSVLAGCNSDTRTTGQVDSVAAGRICVTPENSDLTDLDGCWPISADDAAGLEQADCIEARIPSSRDDAVTDVRKLDRACHIGVEPKASTGTALMSVIWLVGISAVLVYVGAVLPRRHAKRLAGTLAPRRNAPARPSPPPPPSAADDPTIVLVVEGHPDPDRHPHHRRK